MAFCGVIGGQNSALEQNEGIFLHKSYIVDASHGPKYASGAISSENDFKGREASDLYLAGILLFKVNNRNTRIMCEICSKLTIKTRLLTSNRLHT